MIKYSIGTTLASGIPSVSTPSTLLELLEYSPSEQTAIVLPEHHLRLSYGALRDQVQAVAEQLAAAGVGRGDRVGIALPNGLPMIVSFLAASVAGTAAPLNPAYMEEEFRFYLEDTGARVLILPPDGLEEARRAAGDRVRILTIDMDAAGTVTLSGTSGVIGRRSVVPPSVDDVALVLHTSGSTGRPKRVPLAHAHLSISAGNVARNYALTSDDVSLCVMPLFHVHGLVASTLATLATGGTVVVPLKFRPLSFWRVARDHGVTWYSAVPALHQLLLARAGDPSDPARRPAGTERLRFIRSCSAPLPPRVMHALEAAFGAPVLEAYGDDRSRASDDIQSAPAVEAQAWIGRVRHGRARRHHGPGRPHLPAGRPRGGRHPGPERHSRLREQSRGQRRVVRQRMVPHRRSRLSGRRRLPVAHRNG